MPDGSMPPLALLVGGFATRMYPATRAVAKSMLPVAGEPMLAHQLRAAQAQEIRNVVLCCGHLEEQLRAFAGDGGGWGLTVRYASDGPQPLGTGGALRAALPLLGEQFLVMYGDSYLPTPMRPVWEAFVASGSEGLMTVYRNEDLWDQSNVHFDDGRIAAYSKTTRTQAMRHIDYGLNCLRVSALCARPTGARFDLAEVHAALLERGQLAGYEVQERFYEIGSPAGLAETDCFLRSHTPAASTGRPA